MRPAIRSLLFAVLALVGAAGASAAPITVTTTPETIYLFVVLVPAASGRAPFEELYQSTDKAACESQAKDWSAALAPNKFVCLPHAQKKLKPIYGGGGGSSGDDN